MLVGNLEKVFTFQRGEALLVESQAWVRYVGLCTPCEQKGRGSCSRTPDPAKELDMSE